MNPVGLVPLAIATIGCAFAGLVLRGHARRDNLVFGILALVDAALYAWRGLNVLTGGSIVSPGVVVPCTIGSILLSMLTYEFVAAFPRRPPMAWKWRTVVILWGVAAIAVCAAQAGGTWHVQPTVELYFLPSTIILLGMCVVAFAGPRSATRAWCSPCSRSAGSPGSSRTRSPRSSARSRRPCGPRP